jgi:hypothetical protein
MVSVDKVMALLGSGTRVKVYSAAAGAGEHLMGEGVVIAVCEAPSFCVQAPDGTRTWHSTVLPVKVETWQPL